MWGVGPGGGSWAMLRVTFPWRPKTVKSVSSSRFVQGPIPCRKERVRKGAESAPEKAYVKLPIASALVDLKSGF